MLYLDAHDSIEGFGNGSKIFSFEEKTVILFKVNSRSPSIALKVLVMYQKYFNIM